MPHLTYLPSTVNKYYNSFSIRNDGKLEEINFEL